MYLDRSRVDRIVRGVLTLAFALALACETAHAAETLHFAVGPLQPTPSETKTAFDPFFKHLAERLGVTYTLDATTDGRASQWRSPWPGRRRVDGTLGLRDRAQ